MTEEERMADVVESLTPRKREVVELIGGELLSYREAGERMGHFYQGGRALSPDTVRKYATEVRDAMGSDRKPRAALIDLYRHSSAWVRG